MPEAREDFRKAETMSENVNTFEGWAILELMGHRRLAGLLSETQIGGAAFIRIDVPNQCTETSANWCPVHGKCACPDRSAAKDDPACPLHSEKSEHGAENVATQFYAPSAVYCITPVSETLARKVAASSQPAPVTKWDLPAERALPAAASSDDADDGPDDDDEADDYEDRPF